MTKAFRPTTLEHLIAMEEIRQLVLRYSFCVDGGRGVVDAAIYELFTEDGVWDSSDNGHGRYVGRQALSNFFSGGGGKVRPTWYNGGRKDKQRLLVHSVNNPLITEFDGDEARGIVTYNGQVLFDGVDYVVLEAGRYNDHYARTADGWRFKSRVLEHVLPSRKLALTLATPEQSLPDVADRLKDAS